MSLAARNTRMQATGGTKVLGMDLGFDVDARLMRWIGLLVLEGAVIAGVTGLLLMPRWAELSKLRRDVNQQSSNLRNLQQKEDQLDNFLVQFAGVENLMKAAFPPVEDVGLILASVRQIATLAGVEILGYQINPVTIEGTGERARASTAKTKFPMDLRINGSAAGIQTFLKLVDESMPLKRVGDIEVSQTVRLIDGQANQTFEVKLVLENYYLPLTERANPAGVLKPFDQVDLDTLSQLRNYIPPEVATGSAVQVGNPNLFGL